LGWFDLLSRIHGLHFDLLSVIHVLLLSAAQPTNRQLSAHNQGKVESGPCSSPALRYAKWAEKKKKKSSQCALRQAQGPLSTQTSSGTATHPSKLRNHFPLKQAQGPLPTQASSGITFHPSKLRDRYPPNQVQGPLFT